MEIIRSTATPYRPEQMDKVMRHRAGITAHRILSVTAGSVFIRRRISETETVTEALPVSAPQLYPPGACVDCCITQHFYHGVETSYSARIIGITPPAFCLPEGTDCE